MRNKGRPRRGRHAPTPLTPLGAAIVAALAVRRAESAAGPRTLADLARAVACSPQQLHHAITGARGTPTPGALVRALPEVAGYAVAGGAPVDASRALHETGAALESAAG